MPSETREPREVSVQDLLQMWAKADEERGDKQGMVMSRNSDWLEARVRLLTAALKEEQDG